MCLINESDRYSYTKKKMLAHQHVLTLLEHVISIPVWIIEISDNQGSDNRGSTVIS